MNAVPEAIEQAEEQLQPQVEAGEAVLPGRGAQQQHRGPHVLGAAQQRLRLLRHRAPVGLDRGDQRVAELLLGAALRRGLQRREGRVVFKVVAARRGLADGRLQGIDEFVCQHVACWNCLVIIKNAQGSVNATKAIA